MESYRSEFEQVDNLNPVVAKDIIDLGRKIEAFHNGTIDSEKFRALRLARGVYGQRQEGVQMIRIKLPFGKVTAAQLRRICQVSDEYSTGHLHITTRQDIQIHYVSLDRTPQLWADLEKDDVTLREACGNTVRNITASAAAGIDPNEVFDVSPYADLLFRYFLRKPFGQELGRKIKIAFSSNEEDDAFTFIHDFGFIPKIRVIDGKEVKGFKVLVGGGLGAQPILAHVGSEFLPANEIIGYVEASIRVFDRYGERNSRNKARMKYLIAKVGFEEFTRLVEEEKQAVQYEEGLHFDPDFTLENESRAPGTISLEEAVAAANDKAFEVWVKTNVIRQKQEGFVAAYVKVPLGNFDTKEARVLADLMDNYTADDLRFTIDQNILLKYIRPEELNTVYQQLKTLGLSAPGYNSVGDVTACPGTDTCNLGISNSTDVARVIEEVIAEEFPEYLLNREIKIKISGCMNSCGQHGLAHIGFHGSSMKVESNTAPAIQVLLGGGKTGDGAGRVAEKVVKVPSKRILQVIRALLNAYGNEQLEDESFNAYYDRLGNKYFYDLLKPLADTSTLQPEDFIDWGQDEKFKTEIGVGECAGVMIDLIATLLFDADDKQALASEAFIEERYADAVYFAYASAIHAAKALLLEKKVRCNTHAGIIDDFETHFGSEFSFGAYGNFKDFVLALKQQKADKTFATDYLLDISAFVTAVKQQRIKNAIEQNENN